MYIPKRFQIKDFDKIKQFIDENSFGTIISQTENQPIATHTPMLLRKIDQQYFVTGHMAKANPQWKSFESLKENVLIIFQGPHTYISSSWYQVENVPTWNYQAVHIYGKIQLMDETELAEDLAILLKKYEYGRKNPVLWETLSEQTKQQINAIVGFKVPVEEIQAAYKLSQNRHTTDFENIIEKLSEGDEQAQQIAKAMQEIRNK